MTVRDCCLSPFKCHSETDVSEADTIDDVDVDMPEMRTCDGNCVRILPTPSMTTFDCHHMFCTDCLKLEHNENHLNCETFMDGHLDFSSISLFDGLSSFPSNDATNNLFLTFQYNDRSVRLDCMNVTYGETINYLCDFFQIPTGKYVNLAWSTSDSSCEDNNHIRDHELLKKLGIPSQSVVYLEVL